MIETRNGSGLVLKQHVWGTGYIDELVQVAVNSDLVADDECDTRYWAMADSNFNVLGIVDAAGVLRDTRRVRSADQNNSIRPGFIPLHTQKQERFEFFNAPSAKITLV
jgi:hypothetical protein